VTLRDSAGAEHSAPLFFVSPAQVNYLLPGIFAKNLDCLPPTDACNLLLAIAPRIGELAGEIARLCGYLPFALRLIADVIAERRNIEPADYMRRLADARKRLELIEACHSPKPVVRQNSISLLILIVSI